jgi:hypothetical protein
MRKFHDAVAGAFNRREFLHRPAEAADRALFFAKHRWILIVVELAPMMAVVHTQPYVVAR